MRAKILLVALLVAFSGSVCKADDPPKIVTAQALLEICQGGEGSYSNGFCGGWLVAHYQAAVIYGKNCPYPGMSAKVLRMMYMNKVTENPRWLGLEAVAIWTLMMDEEFGVPAKNGKCFGAK